MPLATPTRPMPGVESLSNFLSDLLGTTIIVDRAKGELDINDADLKLVTGVFVDDDGGVAGACIADISLAALAGAALAMIPKFAADEQIAAGTLDGNLRDNFYEVANISTRLVNGPSVPHVKITELTDGVPDEIRDLLVLASGRKTYKVMIDGYGEGLFALYAR